MKQFTSHIDYLIQKHDCVIIPDFGGFVLNRESAHISETGFLIAPRVIVGFNPDLKYNDGLLAESYMNVYSISYDAACKKIAEAVNRLNTILNFRQPIQIGNLGKLSLDSENHISFMPNNNLSLSYPETFGLSNLAIKRLLDIENIPVSLNPVKRKRPIFQQILTGIGAAAASILIFFVASTPIAENQQDNIQMSGFLTPKIELTNSIDKSVDTETETLNISTETPSAKEIEISTKVANTVTLKEVTPTETKQKENKAPEIKQNTSKYYIIIGSPGNKRDAQSALKRLKQQGYASANVIESSDRTRIYVASFNNKDQANKYLQSFRRENPTMSDAWLYTKR